MSQTVVIMIFTVSWWLTLSAVPVAAQAVAGEATNPPAPDVQSQLQPQSHATNQISPMVVEAERLRAACIAGRRMICGKIIKVLPDGLVIESGYTNLLRAPLDRSWLVPGTVTASRAPNLVESNEPGAMCVGLVFLSDLPRTRLDKAKTYDYVIIQGFPAGQCTYTSVGDIQRTIRRFSSKLEAAVQFQLLAEAEAARPAAEVK